MTAVHIPCCCSLTGTQSVVIVLDKYCCCDVAAVVLFSFSSFNALHSRITLLLGASTLQVCHSHMKLI